MKAYPNPSAPCPAKPDNGRNFRFKDDTVSATGIGFSTLPANFSVPEPVPESVPEPVPEPVLESVPEPQKISVSIPISMPVSGRAPKFRRAYPEHLAPGRPAGTGDGLRTTLRARIAFHVMHLRELLSPHHPLEELDVQALHDSVERLQLLVARWRRTAY